MGNAMIHIHWTCNPPNECINLILSHRICTSVPAGCTAHLAYMPCASLGASVGAHKWRHVWTQQKLWHLANFRLEYLNNCTMQSDQLAHDTSWLHQYQVLKWKNYHVTIFWSSYLLTRTWEWAPPEKTRKVPKEDSYVVVYAALQCTYLEKQQNLSIEQSFLSFHRQDLEENANLRGKNAI